MELLINYSIYLTPLLFVIIIIAVGIIFKNNKCTGNALLLIGFIMQVFPLVASLLFDISPMEVNENIEVVKRTEGFLSFYQFYIIEIAALFSVTLGFVLNAHATLKKPNKAVKRDQ